MCPYFPYSFKPVFQATPEGEFFEDVKPFSCSQINLLADLQLFRETVIRIAGHHHFACIGFDKPKGEWRTESFRSGIKDGEGFQNPNSPRRGRVVYLLQNLNFWTIVGAPALPHDSFSITPL